MDMRAFADNGRALHAAEGDADKVFVAGRSREEGSVSSEGSYTSKKRMSFPNDMSKEQVEQLVTKLTIGEMKTKWFDEIFAKVKTELEESPQFAPSDTIDTPSTEDTPSPRFVPLDMVAKRPYQATVEDVADEPDDLELSGSSIQTRVSEAPKNETNTSSSVVSDSTSSRVSNRTLARRFSESTARRPLESNPMPRPTVRFSDRAPVVFNSRDPPPRDGPHSIRPGKAPKGAELSAVDASWGRLFDDKGEPTPRLGKVIKGIANYIIAEHTPVSSLVLTPDKLLAFYRRFKLDSETMPFDYMFDVRSPRDYNSLELLFQDLGCSYHLVQGKPNSTPRVPALTPQGFQEWVTRQIQAFPDQESQRLNCIVCELPIAADGPSIDGKAERLPRQLSRHLLPATQHAEIHENVLDAVRRWVKEVGLWDAAIQRHDEHYPSSRYRDEKSGRYRPEDYRGDPSSRSRHKPRESHGKTTDREPSRKDPPGHSTHRPNSDTNLRRSDALPPIISSAKSRSPTSKSRHRSSATSISSAGGDEYVPSPTSSSHWPRTLGDRRNREQEYRFYHGRAGSDSTPRTIVGSSGSRRQSLVYTPPREEPYDYVRASAE